MMYDIYLEKDGMEVAKVGSYKAGKENGRGYVVYAYKIYPTAYAVMNSMDIAELQDFYLICQTSTRRICYHILSWCDEFYPLEENDAIASRQACHCARTEGSLD